MIYQRFGSPVTITAYCGKHQPKGFRSPLMLVKVRYEDDGSDGFQLATFLKADGGIEEIEAAVDAVPEIALEPKALKTALLQAS